MLVSSGPDLGLEGGTVIRRSSRTLPDTLPLVLRPAGLPAPSEPLAAGATVPGYEILGELGRGTMGVVYSARHLRLNRPVALKVVLDGAHASHVDRVRFLDEAEMLARLDHPGVVRVYEVGWHDGRPHLAMEFVGGGTLAQRCGGIPQPPREAARLVAALARAVHHAHERGVVHRDLKPANVMLAGDGAPKITDFGLAKRLDGGAGLTETGAMVGTPGYMAPEQALCREVGPAADVYALGTILYELLTGATPFRADSLLETLTLVVSEPPRPPRQLRPDVPLELEAVCLKCLRKEPADRYASAQALADDLDRFSEGRPTQSRPGAEGQPARQGPRQGAVGPLWGAGALAVAAFALGILGNMAWSKAREGQTRFSPHSPAARTADGRPGRTAT